MHHVQLPAVVTIYFFAIVVALEVEAAFLFTVEIITEHQAVMPVVTHKPWSAVVGLMLLRGKPLLACITPHHSEMHQLLLIPGHLGSHKTGLTLFLIVLVFLADGRLVRLSRGRGPSVLHLRSASLALRMWPRAPTGLSWKIVMVAGAFIVGRWGRN
jgi:hypothetical protein